MLTRRYELGVGVIDGTLYAVGGVTATNDQGGVLGTVEAYNSRINEWTTKTNRSSGTSVPSMATPRVRLAVGVVNGILYAIGGGTDRDEPVGTMEALLL